MDEIDEMFSNLLGEMDLLTQSLEIETLPPPTRSASTTEINFSVGFKDLNESLNALEDNDLDALMAELVADITDAEQNVATYNNKSTAPFPPADASNSYHFHPPPMPSIITEDLSLLPPPPEFDPHYPPPPPDPLTEPKTQEELESKAKANKINLALSKMKEAKVKKRIVKVHMIDSSTKTLMVEEHQTVRDVLDNLFEKTHCDCSIEWCLFEVTPELQIERFFEDHENIVEILANWTRDSVNTIHFLEKNEKYAVFKKPQNFYMATKGSADLKDMNEKNKVSLLEQSFCGASVTVPELEAALYLKEDGKKSWKKRYFLLRASGIYYVPKGKTKTSRDLACFVQFDNVNVYYGTQYRMKYKAPTDHCFVLKHPQIQKESQYIKYLCCEDPWLLHQWVTGIRIAKYGKILYDNYKTAVQRGGLASHWSTLGSSSVSTAAGSSQGNGQICQNVTTISSSFSDAWKHGEANKQEKKSSEVNKPETKSATPTVTKRPPPTPRRASSISRVTDHPAFPPKPKAINTDIMSGPPQFPPPEPLQPADDFLPPPPPDFFDAPPDFLPPSPPSFMSNAENPPPPPVTQLQMSNAPAPPPPPPPPAPAANVPPLPVKKHPPKPPKRQSIVGPMPGTNAHGGAGGQPDFMSDLMKALQKKREPPT
ncbi:amyloid beta A4 precursor protein-binding family B member 1-interacting protein [Xenopus laevis]|uniref:Amyloid beta A4 precursor protein-binding family B member 1-interacting protein n=1 Tax=Xenopus laevis TaxID=8355 RepID=AB1IP_XENLA|nr:amyloid beta A4 precursor protein-binding family B member 1-interacting protein [Xenopus laevis]Q6DCV1.2 RecName: Full=Amyloid beta A4 precursor protein-binding family B member 1-interacting protein; AltName: Full=APBB1-interacting protein 1 [Xenopus laevis]